MRQVEATRPGLHWYARAGDKVLLASFDAAVVLLDVRGQPLDTLRPEPDLFGRDFAARMTQLLHGRDGERLAATARAQREALGPDLARRFDEALRGLDADAYRTREAAAGQLEELAPRATALLALAARAGLSLEETARVERVWARLESRAADQPNPPLPYGVTWQARAVDPCPACGLSRAPQPTRRFLCFLTQRPR